MRKIILNLQKRAVTCNSNKQNSSYFVDSNNMASNPDRPTTVYQNNQLPGQFQNQPGVCVVDQQPLPSPRFPIHYKTNSVLVISILKTIIGSSQFLFGVFDILYLSLGFEKSNSGLLWAFPVWCGFLVSGKLRKFCANLTSYQ